MIPGSQFSAKVIAALQSRDIQHYVEFVAADPQQRRLPSGGTMVPELLVDDTITVTDSEAILHWIDENLDNVRLFPNETIRHLSHRVSTGVLAGSVWYYNWVNPEGYQASMQSSLRKLLLPNWVPEIIGNFVIDVLALPSGMAKHKSLAAKAMNIEESQLDDESFVRNLLMKELEYIQSTLTIKADYLNGEHQSTAADFSVYAQLGRLVGDASDVEVSPSLPLLKDETKFARLWQFHELMCKRFPVKFKGKRCPKE